MTIPEEIRILVERLRTQDNLSTAWPLYRVEQRKRISGLDPQFDLGPFEWHSEDHEYRYSDSEIQEVIREGLTAIDCDLADVEVLDRDPEEHGWEKVYYIDTWEVVTVHFTMAAAEEYIARNRHNLDHPRVFVSSQYRCPEWQAVIEFLTGRFA